MDKCQKAGCAPGAKLVYSLIEFSRTGTWSRWLWFHEVQDKVHDEGTNGILPLGRGRSTGDYDRELNKVNGRHTAPWEWPFDETDCEAVREHDEEHVEVWNGV